MISFLNNLINIDSDPYLIAEIGINHNGDINIAKKLIDAVNGCDWDCVKFQKRNPDICVPEDQKNVIRSTPWGEMRYIDYKYKLEFNKEEYDDIEKFCQSKKEKLMKKVNLKIKLLCLQVNLITLVEQKPSH